MGEFSGVKLLSNGDTVRLLCGKRNHDGDEIPVEYEGLSAELRPGDAILVADGLIRLTVKESAGEKASFIDCVVEDGGPFRKHAGGSHAMAVTAQVDDLSAR